jgi:hypothetical protein
MLRSVLLGAALCAAGIMLSVGAADAASKGKCVNKAGEGWGFSKEMAQFQSYEIIQQVTGNWPFQTDAISKPVYSCKGSGGGWTCIARATVCSKA